MKTTLFLSLVCYMALSLFYFSPVAAPCKIVYPVALLFLCSLYRAPYAMSVALLFSAIGDYMGAVHNFWGQMGFFALAHVALIVHFLSVGEGRGVHIVPPAFSCTSPYAWCVTFAVLSVAVVALPAIVQSVSDLLLRAGVACYALLILSMTWLALLRRSWCYAIGALCFLFSDLVLAWNKFVEPVEGARYLIMVTYYVAQAMLYGGSLRMRNEGLGIRN